MYESTGKKEKFPPVLGLIAASTSKAAGLSEVVVQSLPLIQDLALAAQAKLVDEFLSLMVSRPSKVMYGFTDVSISLNKSNQKFKNVLVSESFQITADWSLLFQKIRNHQPDLQAQIISNRNEWGEIFQTLQVGLILY